MKFVIITVCPKAHNNFALSIKSSSFTSPSPLVDLKLDKVISNRLIRFSSLISFSFEIISLDFKYISSLTNVTGLKLPLIARIFFFHKTLAGKILFPLGPNITAFVIPFLTSSRLINLLST